MLVISARQEPLKTRRAAEARATGLPDVAAKSRKRKTRDRVQLQGLLDAHKDARARGGRGAPAHEILAYPIAPPEDDIPF